MKVNNKKDKGRDIDTVIEALLNPGNVHDGNS